MEFMGLSCANLVNGATVLAAFVALSASVGLQAKAQEQQSNGQASQEQPSQPAPAATAGQGRTSQNGSQLLRLTFQTALQLARKNSIQFQAAVTNFGLLRGDRAQARDALLPSVNYNNSAIYTQSSGALPSAVPGAPPVIFIANNAPHEYVSQGNVHEVLDVSAFASWRRASAPAALHRPHQQIPPPRPALPATPNYHT